MTLKSLSHIAKKRSSSLLVFCIFSTQINISAVIYNSHLISHAALIWGAIYHLLMFFSAVPQAGFSDVYGRKRHLTIASCSVLAATIYVSLMYSLKIISFANDHPFYDFVLMLPICLFLGVAGNAVPIARAGIADLQIHDFRTAMGWATTFIGFGWVTTVMLGLVLPPLGVLAVAIAVQILAILLIRLTFLDYRDFDFISERYENPIKVARLSYRWFFNMFMVTGGAAALCAYLLTEMTFYQIYTLNEEGPITADTKVIGLLMAFGYASGVAIQWIVYCSDKVNIKFGILFSFIFLILCLSSKIYAEKYENIYYIERILFPAESAFSFLFAFGFGFFVPALFSLMSKSTKPHHTGRLFGAIDVMDNAALGLSSILFYFSNIIGTGFLYLILIVFFLSSFLLYRRFTGRFFSYEN